MHWVCLRKEEKKEKGRRSGKREVKAEKGGEGRDLSKPGLVRKALSVVVFSVSLLLLHSIFAVIVTLYLCYSYSASLLL